MNEMGHIDITPGRYYPVYGKQYVEHTWWYLVHTDSEFVEGYWWMPSGLYKVYDPQEPEGWSELDKESRLCSYSILKDWKVYEGIEDGEKEYISMLAKEVANDTTFNGDQKAAALNQVQDERQARVRRQENKKLAADRGWDENLLNSDDAQH